MKDHTDRTITGYEEMAGVQVPFNDEFSSKTYLHWGDEIRGNESPVLTDPYGTLEFACGSGDDFTCFDYARLPDGRIILDAVWNTETGGSIERVAYEVVNPEDAVDTAVSMVDSAEELLMWNDGIRHTTRGWNQDPFYFARSVAWLVGYPRIKSRKRWTRISRDPISWYFKPIFHGNPKIVRLHDHEALVLEYPSGYQSEPIGVFPADNIYTVLGQYITRYGWDKEAP